MDCILKYKVAHNAHNMKKYIILKCVMYCSLQYLVNEEVFYHTSIFLITFFLLVKEFASKSNQIRFCFLRVFSRGKLSSSYFHTFSTFVLIPFLSFYRFTETRNNCVSPCQKPMTLKTREKNLEKKKYILSPIINFSIATVRQKVFLVSSQFEKIFEDGLA